MGKNTVFIILGLTLIWLVLLESFTVVNLAVGIVMSAGSIYICHKLLPLPKIAKDIKLFRFAIYPFYLAGQMYLSAFSTMKLIFTEADVAIVEVKTQISNSFLRTILANSITLTPGSISLALKDNAIIMLWLKEKKDTCQNAEKAAEAIKRKLEKILIKAEK